METVTDEQFENLIAQENTAKELAMSLANAAQDTFEGMTSEQRNTMDDSDPMVKEFLKQREEAYAARLELQRVSSERLMAEPVIRYRHSMAKQAEEPMRLVEAREMVFKMMYAQALVEEHELMAAVMVQGPERLDDHAQACKKTDHFREQWVNAKATLESLPDDATLAPWAAITVKDNGQ